jgi:pimeloyl-ACP methyl ester carboxylesterase
MASEIFDAHDNPFATHHLIFFVTGNPGLISYYNNFFRTLHQLLSEGKSKSNAFHIYGESLAGFKYSESPSKDTGAPYNLDQQIESRLQCLKDQRIPSGPRKSEAYDSIILIGHSVGTYIILEMLQRLRNSSSPLNIRAGILLFPTVTHLAESPSGLKFKFLFRIPGFVRGASSAANALLWLFPRPALKWLVKVVTGMPEDATEVTTSFLKSDMGIWQALLVLFLSSSVTGINISSDTWQRMSSSLSRKTNGMKISGELNMKTPRILPRFQSLYSTSGKRYVPIDLLLV